MPDARDMPDTRTRSGGRQARVRAPEFPSGTWVNSTEPLSLASLRGTVVLLDFWTFCCANCLHVIDEIRALEAEFGDRLVVIGVHSPKFEHEKSDQAVRDAVIRYGVAHPVFNDPDMYLWSQYAVHAWPSLVLIDQGGYVVAQAAGEGHGSALRDLISDLLVGSESIARHGVTSIASTSESGLLFPAKAIRLPDTLLIADAGHHQLVQTDLTGQAIRRRIGDGRRGCSATQFAEPNGLALLPSELANRLGYDVVVADTGNHVLRGIRLSDGAIVCTIDLAAGLAEARTVTGAVPSVLSPWDVAWWPALQRVVVAAAGVHLLLSWDPASGQVRILAGTTVEGLKDGPALDGWLAQPSGLAVDGDRLWFVDSETSALRRLDLDGSLHTVVGEGLFDFGHRDGPAEQARLQHPLGVALAPDGSVLIADTYNGAVRRYDPETNAVSTLVTGLGEPSGLVVVDEDVLVVESAAHRLTGLAGGAVDQAAASTVYKTERPVIELNSGVVDIEIRFMVPVGSRLDDRYGPATQLSISAWPPELLLAGSGVGTELHREVTLAAEPTTGILHISAQAASCDDGPHPACHLARQDWGVPIVIDPSGSGVLPLVLLG